MTAKQAEAKRHSNRSYDQHTLGPAAQSRATTIACAMERHALRPPSSRRGPVKLPDGIGDLPDLAPGRGMIGINFQDLEVSPHGLPQLAGARQLFRPLKVAFKTVDV